jgi:membrane-associated PAP2 superfamily phosphatase
MAIDAWVACLGLAMLLLWDGSGADLMVMHVFGTPAGFAWRDAFVTSTLLHQGGRWLGWVVGLAWALHAWWPAKRGSATPRQHDRRDPRRDSRYWLAVAVACLLLVPALKHGSRTSCPWDLQDFGGTAHHVSHWALGVADGGPGHCFPSGHASAAFAFLAGYFLLRRSRPTAARAWLAAVLTAGALFGLAQVARGAHYPSHVLWTGWICWTVCVLADRALPWLRWRPARWQAAVADRS